MEPQIRHRAALEHVLALIAEAPWSDGLVLRGSMLMTAWCGDAARVPADLDFIAVDEARPVDAQDPYPYVELEVVQQWPEVADGAGRYEMWTYEEFDAGGQRPRVAPEGLRWVTEEEWEPPAPYGDLVERIRRRPSAGYGVELDAERIDEDGSWGYSDYGMSGVRLMVPWRAAGSGKVAESRGHVQVEFARDEVLPEVPVWTRIPRMDGGQSVLLAASPALSLRWKLNWLVEDTERAGVSRGKDLYDAVLLAELPGLPGSGRVGRSLSREELDSVRIDWDAFLAECPQVRGTTLVQWKRRLAEALGIGGVA